jgi:outer membrane beta-barrel protein
MNAKNTHSQERFLPKLLIGIPLVILSIQASPSLAQTSTTPSSPKDSVTTSSGTGKAVGAGKTNQSGDTIPVDNSSSDKIDLGTLEQKYWSAKDDDFTVVQNRTYSKKRKIFVSAMTGILVNDGFLEGTPNALAVGYFLTEKHGLSLDYTSFTTRNNQVTNLFLGKGGLPDYNSPISTASLTYMWSPIYAKVSLLERKILYLDMSVGVHVGVSKYRINTDYGGVIKQTSHYGIDVSQLWFISKRMAFRFDIRSTWAKQDKYRYHVASNVSLDTQVMSPATLQDNTWLLGFNYFFGR